MTTQSLHLAEAAALLLAGGLAQFAWKHAPPDAQADVWNVSQALLVLVLLAGWAVRYRARLLLAVVGLLAVWQLLTAGCSLAWLVQPWPVRPGQEACSAALDLPLGAVGLWLLLLLAAALVQQLRAQQQQPQPGGDHGAR